MKKLFSALLISALLLGLFSSCGSPPESDSQQPTDSTTDTSTQESTGETLQVILPSNVQDFPEGVTPSENFIIDYWTEQTGINFDVIVLPNVSTEEAEAQLNLMFQANEVTGLVFSKSLDALGRYYDQDLLRSFDGHTEGSAFFDMFGEYQTKGILGGEQYGAIIPPDGIPCASGLYAVRKDLLEGYGITEEPKTFDEFNDMLETVKSNGLIPLVVSGSPLSDGSWDMIKGFFGVNSTANRWSVRDGEAAYRFTLPETYDFLVYAKSLYDNGMIPQDFTALQADSAMQLYLSGEAATISLPYVWDQPNMMLQSQELGLDTRYMDYPNGVSDEKTYGAFDRLAASQVVFASKELENMDLAVQLLDFLVQDDTIEINNYGIEGEHFTLEDDQRVLTEAGESIQWAVYYRNVFLPQDWYPIYGVNANWAEYIYPSERHSVGYTDFDPVQFMPVMPDNAATEADLEDIFDQYFTKAITGEVELSEETFNATVQEWLNEGGQEISDSYTELYKELGSPDFSNLYVSYLPESHPEYTGINLWNGQE